MQRLLFLILLINNPKASTVYCVRLFGNLQDAKKSTSVPLLDEKTNSICLLKNRDQEMVCLTDQQLPY